MQAMSAHADSSMCTYSYIVHIIQQYYTCMYLASLTLCCSVVTRVNNDCGAVGAVGKVSVLAR